MKTRLSKSWMPSENVLSLAKSKVMPIEDWLYHLIPEWKLYWLERNVLRCWDATFWNHAKKEWKKVDKSRMYRQPQVIDADRAVQFPQSGQVGNITPAQSIERFNKQWNEFNK